MAVKGAVLAVLFHPFRRHAKTGGGTLELQMPTEVLQGMCRLLALVRDRIHRLQQTPRLEQLQAILCSKPRL